FLLADARGSLWSGSALPVLAGGPDSLEARALPSRLQWTLGLDGFALALRARQPCCIHGELALRVAPAWGGLKISLPAAQGSYGQWPAAWLDGLGTPFNPLRLGGWLSLSGEGLVVESAAGRWRLAGQALLRVDDLSARVSGDEKLGSYRLALSGGSVARIALSTLDGPLELTGNGQWGPGGLRFRGLARAAPGYEAGLNNLLNLLGRRQGAAAVLSIG
ncbi:MAG: type II secretion system protein N, partial [Burkholderiales bacterium]|nr:type II secretion system protein N [Burkholderiales bacterium]